MMKKKLYVIYAIEKLYPDLVGGYIDKTDDFNWSNLKFENGDLGDLDQSLIETELEKIVGKSRDGLNTVITGTERISNLVVRNEVNNQVLKNSLKQKQLVDDYLAKVDELIKGGRSEADAIAAAGPRPTAPTVVDNSFEAEKYSMYPCYS